MTKRHRDGDSVDSVSLRARAEAMLATSAADLTKMSTEEVRRVVHELQVHQMELEIQNEELRGAQMQLAESRDRYADLYDFAPVGYLTLDSSGVIEEANLSAAALLGIDRKALLGRKFSRFVSDDSQDAWHIHRRQVFSEKATCVCELTVLPSGGSPATLRLQSLAFPDEHGNWGKFRTAIADVSERRIAFDALSQLNVDLNQLLSSRTGELTQIISKVRLLSEAVSHLGEGVLITGDDLDWPGPTIVFVNEAMSRITGYAEDELIGQSPRILQGDATDRDTLKRLQHELRTGESSSVELVNYRKDGSAYTAELFITPLFNEDGQRTNFVSIHRDVTERRKTERKLSENEERLRLALQATNDAVWDLDLLTGKVWCNEAYRQQFARPPQTHSWDRWAEQVHPDDRDRVTRSLNTFVSGEGHSDRWSSEYRFLRKDGSYAYVTNHAIRSYNTTGEVIRVLGALVDVTERRDLERQVLDIAAEEHRRIGNDLHDGVGQELTGLSMIAGALVIALSRKSMPELQIAEKIDAGVKRALHQVRALARGMDPVNVDTHGLMSSLSEMTSRLSDLYDVQVTFECDEPVSFRDNQAATQLYRIAQEATTNSIKHGHARHIVVALHRRGGGVVLSIADDGCGIADDSVTRQGMGLRTMNYRAGVVSGELRIANRDGGGTVVTCTVPASVLREE